MRIVRFLGFLFFGLVLSAAIALYYVGNDAQFRQKIERSLFQDMSHDLHCTLSGHVESCNLITAQCTLKDVVAHDATHQWKWSAHNMVISWSWIKYFLKHVVPLTIDFYNVELTSQIANKKLSITDHFQRWSKLTEGPIKTVVKTLRFHNITSSIASQDGNLSFRGQGNGYVNIIHDGASIALALDNGSLWLTNQLAFASLNGSINIAVNAVTSGDFQLSGGCTFANIMKKCLIAGSWKDNDFSAHLNSENRLLDITMGINPTLLTLGGTLPCADFLKVIHAPHLEHEGICTFALQTPMEKPFDSYTGSVTINNWSYKTRILPSYTGEFDYHDKVMHGKGLLEFYGVKGAANYVWNDAAHTVSTHITFTEPLKFERFSAHTDIAESYLNFRMNLTEKIGNGSGKIVVRLPEHKTQTLDLNFKTEPTKIALNLGLAENKLNLVWLDDQEWYFAAGDFYRTNKHRGTIRQLPNGTFKGECAMAAIARIMSALTDSKIFGAGIVHFNGNQNDTGINVHGTYEAGEFRIQNLYNGIQSAQFDCTYQIANRTALLHTLTAQLNKGSIHIDHGVATLKPNYSLQSYYIPLTLNDCFLHWKKEASANATGYITLSQSNNIANIGGYLVMDKGQVHSNILSASPEQYLTIGMIKPFISSETQTNVAMSIKTSTPIKVAASVLTAEVSLDLSFKGNIAAPHIQGSVDISKGTIHLPYQPLYITEGKIYFLPNQFDKPMVKLIAKNKIQKYFVTMQVTGTIEKPKFSFDSSPSLTEQQIISLLLSGSDDGMLNIALPFNISQTMESLLFGTPESSSKAQRSLGGFLDSLKNIRVIPRLGGKHGSLLIELSDNLRATIQKDLSNTEESRIEVEYGIGDDMVIRAVKDEHGEVGAEFEKSWKFS